MAVRPRSAAGRRRNNSRGITDLTRTGDRHKIWTINSGISLVDKNKTISSGRALIRLTWWDCPRSADIARGVFACGGHRSGVAAAHEVCYRAPGRTTVVEP